MLDVSPWGTFGILGFIAWKDLVTWAFGEKKAKPTPHRVRLSRAPVCAVCTDHYRAIAYTWITPGLPFCAHSSSESCKLSSALIGSDVAKLYSLVFLLNHGWAIGMQHNQLCVTLLSFLPR